MTEIFQAEGTSRELFRKSLAGLSNQREASMVNAKWAKKRVEMRQKVTKAGPDPCRTSGAGVESLDFARYGMEQHERLNEARESHDPMPDLRTSPWLLV